MIARPVHALWVLSMVMAVLSVPAPAQTYPVRPIRMIVPFAPGGGTDINARIVSQKISDQMGVPVVVDNRPGGGALIGTDLAAKAPPDGYTLLTIASEHAINPSLRRTMPYDALKDFAPVTQTVSGQYLLSVHPSVPANTVNDLLALARSRPGQLTYGSSGNGSANHLAGVMLQEMAGIRIVHVPYKGAGPAAVALLSGELNLMFSSTSAAAGHVKAGKLRAIAVTGARRFAQMPETPTVAESGVPGYQVTGWYMILAPARTPAAVVSRLNAEIVKAVQDSGVRKRFDDLGSEAIGSSPRETTAFLASEIERWRRVVKASGAQSE